MSSLTECGRIQKNQGHRIQAQKRRASRGSVKCGASKRTLEGAASYREGASASAGTKTPFAADARASPIAKSRRQNQATTTAVCLLVAADKIDIKLNKNTKITHCSHKMNVLRVECEAFCENILILLNGISCGAS